MPKVNFLFWNIADRPLQDRVGRIVATHAVDVVLLAECATNPNAVAAVLNTPEPDVFRMMPETASGLRVFTRSGPLTWVAAQTGERWLAYRVSSADIPEFLLVVAHLPSKLHTREDDQRLVVRSLVEDVVAHENRLSHRRTALVGDLNMNPFESGVTAFGELHGVMSRGIAGRETRTVRGRDDRMFYNPMWGLFGDRTPGPPGTYYRSSGGVVNYHWNIYDQLLLRPAMMDCLTSLRILDSDGTDSLLTRNGLPDSDDGSDHLPVLFRLDW